MLESLHDEKEPEFSNNNNHIILNNIFNSQNY